MRWLLLLLTSCVPIRRDTMGGLGETCEQVRAGPEGRSCDVLICWHDNGHDAARLVAHDCRELEVQPEGEAL